MHITSLDKNIRNFAAYLISSFFSKNLQLLCANLRSAVSTVCRFQCINTVLLTHKSRFINFVRS